MSMISIEIREYFLTNTVYLSDLNFHNLDASVILMQNT